MATLFIPRPLLCGEKSRHNFFFAQDAFLACVPVTRVLYTAVMENDIILTYRGKSATKDDIEFINLLIKEHPTASRRALSQELCRAWDWVQANGSLRDMVARGFMLELHRKGHITLPVQRQKPPNPFLNRTRPPKIDVDQTLVAAGLSRIRPIEIYQVRNTSREKLFNSLIEHHHYLGYCHPVGEQLKYMAYKDKKPIACFSWSSAPRHIGVRDRHIGWDKEHRAHNLQYIAYNSRFLILPWIQVPHLASHLLGLMARNISRDWESAYHHPIYFLETFVDKERFSGTCYKAANWHYLGDTTGRGKNEKKHIQTRSIKAVWGYPLTRNFRKRMTGISHGSDQGNPARD